MKTYFTTSQVSEVYQLHLAALMSGVDFGWCTGYKANDKTIDWMLENFDWIKDDDAALDLWDQMMNTPYYLLEGLEK